MVSAVIAGISGELSEVFGDGYKVYTEDLTQDLHAPCFSVTCTSSVYKPMLGKRYSLVHSCIIKYNPVSKSGPQAECYEVSNTLFDALYHITAGGSSIIGTNMSCSFNEGALEFLVDYEVFCQAVEDADLMGTINLSFTQNKPKG